MTQKLSIYRFLILMIQLILLSVFTAILVKIFSGLLGLAPSGSILASTAFFPPFILSYFYSNRTKTLFSMRQKLGLTISYLACQALFMKLDTFIGWYSLVEIGFYTLLGFVIGQKVFEHVHDKISYTKDTK